MNQKTSVVLITGCPGVGKTTVIKKISHMLQQKPLNFKGFYTEELRNEKTHERIGFDVIDFNGNRNILARSSTFGPNTKGPKIGKYTVYVDKFEILAIPIIQSNANCLIIDEIGKMELLSKTFEKEIKNILVKVKSGNMKLIATIPNQQSIKIINEFKSLDHAKLFEITKNNRNNIYHEIEKCCLEIF